MAVVEDNGKSSRPSVVNNLAEKLELRVCRTDQDLQGLEPEVTRLLGIPLPVYFEDDVESLGICAVCGKRGSFHRCVACGLLAHLSCLGSTFECSRCSTAPFPDAASVTQLGLRRHRFAKGTLLASPVGLD